MMEIAKASAKSTMKYGAVVNGVFLLYSIGSSAYKYKQGDITSKQFCRTVVKRIGGTVGSIGMTGAGSFIGTLVFPGIGTFIGGFVGGMTGDYLGSWVGGKCDDAL